jgi:hypothetical protein
MRLRDLDASFLGAVAFDGRQYQRMDSIDGAQGVMFQCPKCAEGQEPFEKDGRRGFRGAHYVICWFTNPINAPRVADDVNPKPGRWNAAGTSLDDLTFVGPGATSVLMTSPGGCGWHGFVTNGDAS